jgi:hypothetical protein
LPTQITAANHGDSLQGSPEKRLTYAPDGTLWALVVVQGGPGTAKFFRSLNGGTTWSYAGGSDISLLQSSAVPSFVIDADGYAHVCWCAWAADPQVIKYARGTPKTGGGFSWQVSTISPAAGRLNVDTDLIAFRNGTGWVVWIAYIVGNTANRVARLNIAANGAISVAATASGPAGGALANQIASLEFVSTGDGLTPAAAPHVYQTTAQQGAAGPIYINKAVYSGGNWTWAAPVQLVASARVDNTTLATVHDGDRLMVAYSANSPTINVYEYDGTNTPIARNPPAAPGGTGNVLGLSVAVDKATQNIYLAYYDATDGDIRYSVFNRGTLTWSAWTISVSQTPPGGSADGKVQLVRHPPKDSVDMVFAQGGGTSWTILYQQLAPLTRSPGSPTLISPASGALADLAAGQVFTWTYNPVSSGDSQQAWAFRRTLGTVVDYWNNATQSFQSGLVYNTSALTLPSQVAFPAGKWANGNTYSWSVSTRSSTGANSSFATDRVVVATAAPVVIVTAPTGISYGESTPLVTWSYTGLDAQRDYQVAVFTEDAASAPGFDPATATSVWRSGVVPSSIGRSHRIAVALSDSVAYRVYVRSTSTASVPSAWAYSQFLVSLNPPLGPLVELRDEIWYGTEVPRVRMDVLAQSNFLSADQASGQSGWDNDTNATVEAQADDTPNQLLAGLKMTSLAGGLMVALTSPGSPPPAPYGQPQPLGPLSFPVRPGVVYTARAQFKTGGTIRAARVSIRWYDADDGTGNLISEASGDQVALATTTAYYPAFVTAIAPPTAKLARMSVQVLGATAAGEVFYVSRLALAPGRSTTWQQGGYATTQTITVERSTDGGVTWTTVVTRLKTDLYQQAVARDRLMPFNTDVKYRAYTVVDIGTASALSSRSSLVSTINIAPDVWAFRDPLDDDGEMNAYVIDFQRNDDESSSQHRPAGREYPVVDTEGPQASTGSFVIYVRPKDIDAAVAVIRRTVPMVVQSPRGEVFTARFIRRNYDVEALRARKMTITWLEIAPYGTGAI